MKVAIIGPSGKRRVRVTGVLVGDDAVSGGVGGWEAEQAGKRRRPVLRFKGNPGWSLQVTLVLGSAAEEKSIEAQCRQLVAWGRRPKVGLPPRVKVAGKVRAPLGVDWVIDSLDWGAQIRRGDGRRIQQQVTVTLLEYNKPPPAKKPTEKGKKKKRKKKP